MTDDSKWVVIRYDGNWPSHPDEDLPDDGALVEMCRGGNGVTLYGIGKVRRVVVDGHQSAEMDSMTVAWSGDAPLSDREGGVVWRYVEKPAMLDTDGYPLIRTHHIEAKS